MSKLNAESGIYGACVGDVFNNWVGMLERLYKTQAEPEHAWIYYKHIIEQEPWLWFILGNHDLWNTGVASPIVEHARGLGMIVRRSGGRFFLDLGTDKPITISMRHIWPGNSMYSDAHNVKRAATFGHTDDDIIVGGHFHKGELRTHVRPSDGKVSKLAAISSYKRWDDFANDRGFMSAETPPCVWAVCDAREPYTSHSRVQLVYDFNTAVAIKESQRGKNDF